MQYVIGNSMHIQKVNAYLCPIFCNLKLNYHVKFYVFKAQFRSYISFITFISGFAREVQ